MEVLDAVTLPKGTEILRGRLRVHGISGTFTGENPLADAGGSLFLTELPEKRQRVRAYIDKAGFPVFGGGDIYALLRRVLQITPDRDRSRSPIYITPLEAAQFASASAAVCGKVI